MAVRTAIYHPGPTLFDIPFESMTHMWAAPRGSQQLNTGRLGRTTRLIWGFFERDRNNIYTFDQHPSLG